jgi:hypothetical protein
LISIYIDVGQADSNCTAVIKPKPMYNTINTDGEVNNILITDKRTLIGGALWKILVKV